MTAIWTDNALGELLRRAFGADRVSPQRLGADWSVSAWRIGDYDSQGFALYATDPEVSEYCLGFLWRGPCRSCSEGGEFGEGCEACDWQGEEFIPCAHVPLQRFEAPLGACPGCGESEWQIGTYPGLTGDSEQLEAVCVHCEHLIGADLRKGIPFYYEQRQGR